MSETKIAIYIRLSNADGETGKDKDESNSVVNQRSLIHHFLDGHPELSGYPRVEFVDDGFTGTNMERPAFQRMIAAIREGRFNCCITNIKTRYLIQSHLWVQSSKSLATRGFGDLAFSWHRAS